MYWLKGVQRLSGGQDEGKGIMYMVWGEPSTMNEVILSSNNIGIKGWPWYCEAVDRKFRPKSIHNSDGDPRKTVVTWKLWAQV